MNIDKEIEKLKKQKAEEDSKKLKEFLAKVENVNETEIYRKYINKVITYHDRYDNNFKNYMLVKKIEFRIHKPWSDRSWEFGVVFKGDVISVGIESKTQSIKRKFDSSISIQLADLGWRHYDGAKATLVNNNHFENLNNGFKDFWLKYHTRDLINTKESDALQDMINSKSKLINEIKKSELDIYGKKRIK